MQLHLDSRCSYLSMIRSVSLRMPAIRRWVHQSLALWSRVPPAARTMTWSDFSSKPIATRPSRRHVAAPALFPPEARPSYTETRTRRRTDGARRPGLRQTARPAPKCRSARAARRWRPILLQPTSPPSPQSPSPPGTPRSRSAPIRARCPIVCSRRTAPCVRWARH